MLCDDHEKTIVRLTSLDDDQIEIELASWKKAQLRDLYQFIYPDNEFTCMDKEDYVDDLSVFIESQKQHRIEDSVDYYDTKDEDISSWIGDAGYVVDPIERSAFITTTMFIKNGSFKNFEINRFEDYGVEFNNLDDEDQFFEEDYMDLYSNIHHTEDNQIVYKPKIKKKKLTKKQERKEQLLIHNQSLGTNFKEVLKANNLEQWLAVSLVDVNLFDFLPDDDVKEKTYIYNLTKEVPVDKPYFSEDIQLVKTDNKIDIWRNIIYDIARHPLDDQHYNYYVARMKIYLQQIFYRSKRYDESINKFWNVAFIPSGSGKTYLASKFKEKYVDIDSLLYQRLDYVFIFQKIQQYSFVKGKWDLLNYFWNYLVYLNRFRIGDKILLCHSINQINYTLTKRLQIGLIGKYPGNKTFSLANYNEIKNSGHVFLSDRKDFDFLLTNYFLSFNKINQMKDKTKNFISKIKSKDKNFKNKKKNDSSLFMIRK